MIQGYWTASAALLDRGWKPFTMRIAVRLAMVTVSGGHFLTIRVPFFRVIVAGLDVASLSVQHARNHALEGQGVPTCAFFT